MVDFGEKYRSLDYGKVQGDQSDWLCFGVYSITFHLSPNVLDEDENVVTMYISFMEIMKTCECSTPNFSDSGQPKYRVPSSGPFGSSSYSMWLIREELGNFPPCPSWDCKCDWGDVSEKWSQTLDEVRNPIYKFNLPPSQGTPEEVFQQSMENYVENKLREAQQAFSHCCVTY